MLDHITSMPGLVLPIKQMVALCHERGVPEVCIAASLQAIFNHVWSYPAPNTKQNDRKTAHNLC
jgi:hypothetical protein